MRVIPSIAQSLLLDIQQHECEAPSILIHTISWGWQVPEIPQNNVSS